MSTSCPRTELVAVAMLGARRHYAVPRILYQSGLLAAFYTDIYSGNQPLLSNFVRAVGGKSPPRLVSAWLGRDAHRLPREKVISLGASGLHYAWCRSRAKTATDRMRANIAVGEQLATRLYCRNFSGSSVVYGVESASLEIFASAKQKGLRCILDQSIAPREVQRNLILNEVRQWPDWGRNSLVSSEEEHKWRLERERKEWDLADLILAPSSYIQNSLVESGVAAEKVRLVPFGVDTNIHELLQPRRDEFEMPLRVLFAGEVGLRKGAPYILEALATFGSGQVEARFAGGIALKATQLDKFSRVATFLGRIPRCQMKDLYHWADVLVLPSIVEGSAAVTYEALSSGVPVIATANVGSLVQDGIDGFIVPTGSSDAIAERLRLYLNDRHLLESHKEATIRARDRVTLVRYRADLVDAISQVL